MAQRLFRFVFTFFIALVCAANALAQYPTYIGYSTENGLPSDEVYSVAQDEQGFIWIGSDAGLYKFDGVRYIPYRCPTQTSKSVAGLSVSSDHRMYCYNFQDQLFYLENDSMIELEHSYSKILKIAPDQHGNLMVNHRHGVSVYSSKTGLWIDERSENQAIDQFTNSAIVFPKTGEFKYLSSEGIGSFADGKFDLIPSQEFSPSGNFILDYNQEVGLIFSKIENKIFIEREGRISAFESPKLSEALQNLKITNVKYLADQKFWICTYKGIFSYDFETDSISAFYPELAFTDMLIDREGSYWFSTLHSGLLRAVDLNSIVWETKNAQVSDQKLTHITSDGEHIFFSTVNGFIGKFDRKEKEFIYFYAHQFADIESFRFEPKSQTLHFYQNGSYVLKNDKIEPAPYKQRTKDVLHLPPFYFLGNSYGLYQDGLNKSEKLLTTWIRQLEFDTEKRSIYCATNDGLIVIDSNENGWFSSDTLLKNTQILSIDFGPKNDIFSLSFNGEIWRNETLFFKLPENAFGKKIICHQNELFVATSKGIWRINLSDKSHSILNKSVGLVSDNVQDFLILDDALWLIAGKGIQSIPLKQKTESSLARIFLKNRETSFDFNYGEPLVLYPEANHYKSNGEFEFAYKINDNEWLKLPSDIEKIEIQNLPSGEFKIELKVIDYLGRDGENSIFIQGEVTPPFWKTTWFVLLIILLFALIFYFYYRFQLEKQAKELKRQNELNLAKLSAIRSQMNPHFIFNSLNSIQDLILQKKTVESYDYIVLFSELVRNALINSSKDFIPIQEEIEFLDTYLQLEQLRFKNDFEFEISMDEMDEIDVPSLLLQPFVENALFHGLLHKEGKKNLRIHFSLSEDELVCTIDDNGIGRKQADIIRKRQRSDHESFALKAIQTRLNIFNEQFGQEVGRFHFEELNPEAKDTGTRVIIHLPFKRHF